MKKPLNNFAFIDSQNLNLGVKKLGWKLDYYRFRVYLEEKYGISKAYLFIGYMPEYKQLYRLLYRAGFKLVFKPIIKDRFGMVKGNVDAELVLQTMIDYNRFNTAIIVSSDGDFYCLVKYLHQNNKLNLVLSPDINNCSILLKKAAKDRIIFIDKLRSKLEYKKRGTA